MKIHVPRAFACTPRSSPVTSTSLLSAPSSPSLVSSSAAFGGAERSKYFFFFCKIYCCKYHCITKDKISNFTLYCSIYPLHSIWLIIAVTNKRLVSDNFPFYPPLHSYYTSGRKNNHLTRAFSKKPSQRPKLTCPCWEKAQ